MAQTYAKCMPRTAEVPYSACEPRHISTNMTFHSQPVMPLVAATEITRRVFLKLVDRLARELYWAVHDRPLQWLAEQDRADQVLLDGIDFSREH
jgi:hypothetical protein